MVVTFFEVLVIVLLVGLRILLGLVWRPEEIFTVQLS